MKKMDPILLINTTISSACSYCGAFLISMSLREINPTLLCYVFVLSSTYCRRGNAHEI